MIRVLPLQIHGYSFLLKRGHRNSLRIALLPEPCNAIQQGYQAGVSLLHRGPQGCSAYAGESRTVSPSDLAWHAEQESRFAGSVSLLLQSTCSAMFHVRAMNLEAVGLLS